MTPARDYDRLCLCGHVMAGHHRFRRNCMADGCPCTVASAVKKARKR